MNHEHTFLGTLLMFLFTFLNNRFYIEPLYFTRWTKWGKKPMWKFFFSPIPIFECSQKLKTITKCEPSYFFDNFYSSFIDSNIHRKKRNGMQYNIRKTNVFYKRKIIWLEQLQFRLSCMFHEHLNIY